MGLSIEEILRFGLWVDPSADDDSDDESVDTQDTGHDDGDDRFHHQFRPHYAHGRHPDPALGGAVSRSHACEKRDQIDTRRLDIGEKRKKKGKEEDEMRLQEKTRAAAAPRNPKKGAVSSPLKGAIFDLG